MILLIGFLLHLQLKWHYDQKFGVTDKVQGYSSYLFLYNISQNHCIIGTGRQYILLRIALCSALVLFTILTGLIMPPVLIKFWTEMLEGENADESRYFIGSTVISSILGYSFVLPYSIRQFTQRLSETKLLSDAKFYYSIVIIFLYLDPLLMFIYVCTLSKRKCLKDPLVNVYPKFLCCCKNQTCLYVFHSIGLTALVCMLQMTAVYATYSTIIVASLAAPVVQSVLFVALWLLMVCNVLTLITVMLKAMNKRISRGTCLAIALFLSLTLVLCLSFAALMSLKTIGGSIQIEYAAIWSLMNIFILIAKKKENVSKLVSYFFSTPVLT